MAVRIKSITFDCADPYRLAQFWSQLTGFSEDPDNDNTPGGPEALLLSPDGSLALLFIAVPEPRHVKNRIRLDLVPLTSRRDEEVDRLLAIGARMVGDQRRPDGGGWVVLSDPEGNEFCIGRSDAERAPLTEQLGRASGAVAGLISNIRPDQWSAPTPCTDWTVRQLVNHLIGMNRVFAALLADQPPPPRPSADHVKDDPVGATATPQPRWRPRSAGPESSNAPTTARSGPPPAPSDCRSGSTTSSPMAGTSRRPRSSPPTCLMI
jgi:predicted enzyme related to lactoylglutathione lyase